MGVMANCWRRGKNDDASDNFDVLRCDARPVFVEQRFAVTTDAMQSFQRSDTDMR